MSARKNNSKKGLILVVVLVGIVFLPGMALRWAIAQSVKNKAPEMIGPARNYSVKVKAGLFDIIQGKIPSLVIRGKDVRPSTGVAIDRLDVELKGIRFKPDQTITDVQSTDFIASVSETSLSDFLNTHRPDMKNAKVSMEDGILLLSASPKIMATRTPVTLQCTLKIVDNIRLNLEVNRLIARGVKVPGFVRGKLQHELNPVFDAQQIGLDARLNTVGIANGAITLTGNADVRSALIR